MQGLFVFVQVISGVITLLLVLAHQPKSEGLGAIGASASQFGGVRSSADDKLDRLTWTAAIVFLLTSALLGLGFIS